MRESTVPIWQMLRAAVLERGARSYSAIRADIAANYGAVNAASLQDQIYICTVNLPSRLGFPENHQPRRCLSRYDFLYNTGRGQVEPYDPARHGEWAIERTANGDLAVVCLDQGRGLNQIAALLGHNLRLLEPELGALTLYCDAAGRAGLAYPAGDQLIDILAVDAKGQLVALMVHAGQVGADALPPLLAALGWLQHQNPTGGGIRGALLASTIDADLRLAVSQIPHISVFEYRVQFSLHEIV